MMILSIRLVVLLLVGAGRVSRAFGPPPQAAGSSPLAVDFEQLATILRGKDRAKLVWEYLRQGRDPWDGMMLEGSDENKASSADDPPLRQRAGREFGQLYRQAFGTSRLSASLARLVQLSQANDGTTKLLVEMARDGLRVETVIIPHDEPQKSALCVSSQVGCQQGCTFCLTGKMGKLRSLTTDEILVQVAIANAVCRSRDIYPIDNVVFMGMGEPADAADAVVPAAFAMAHDLQFQLPSGRISISTVGPTPQSFATLAQAPGKLAWSVHASDNVLRKQLVPTTNYRMEELREGFIVALQGRSKRMRRAMLEVTLLDQINDTPEAAHHLADFSQDIIDRVPGSKLVVNLIPWNDISASFGPAAFYGPPTPERVEAFQQILSERGIFSTVRRARGDDQSSACGQLTTKSFQVRDPALSKLEDSHQEIQSL